MKRILAVIATSCAIIAAVAAPSFAGMNGTTADPAAWNSRTLFLSSHPTDDMATACWERPITLRTAHYGWYNVFDHKVTGQRPIDIAGNTYTWKTCLDPRDGYYDLWSELTGPGYAFLGGWAYRPLTWGNYDVGSELVIE